MKTAKSYLPALLILVIILLLALAFRLYNLTILPVFADEAIYIRWSQIMGNEPTLRFLPLSDGKQPLFMWILMFTIRLFSDPLFAGRILSVFAGLGTIIAISLVSIYLFKNKLAALATALIWAVSPFSLFFERLALVDAMLAMFTVWTLLFALITSKTKRIDTAMITGFMLGFTSLTKSPALFVAMLIPSTWLFAKWPKKNKQRLLELFRLASLLCVSYVIAYAMYNIQRLGPNFYQLSSRTQDYVFPISHLWTSTTDPLKFYLHRSLQWIWIMGPSLFYLLLGWGVLTNFRKYKKEVIVLSLWFLFPWVIQSEFAKVFTARYILFTLPPLYILAGLVLSQKSKKLLKLSSLFLLLFVFQALNYNRILLNNPEKANLPRGERSGYLEEWTAGTGISEVAQYLRNEYYSNPQPIVVGTEGYFGTLPDGLQIYLQDIPQINVIGTGLDFTTVPQSLLESKQAGNKTYLVANSSRIKFEGDFADYGLKVIKSIKKADRAYGFHDYVVHGPYDTFYLLEVTNSAIQ